MACNNPNTQGYLIGECGFDEATQKLLHLSRFYFISYASGEMPDCHAAVDICTEDFGQRYSVEIAIGLLCILGAMRKSRKTIFRFNNTACPKCRNRVSDCERLLFLTLQNYRNGQYSRAYVTAMMLCEGHDTTHLLREIGRLKNFLEKAESNRKKIS
ncbi:MAG: hypothetical protein AAGA53_04760 [Pseudomonadota bacterium]